MFYLDVYRMSGSIIYFNKTKYVISLIDIFSMTDISSVTDILAVTDIFCQTFRF